VVAGKLFLNADYPHQCLIFHFSQALHHQPASPRRNIGEWSKTTPRRFVITKPKLTPRRLITTKSKPKCLTTAFL